MENSKEEQGWKAVYGWHLKAEFTALEASHGDHEKLD